MGDLARLIAAVETGTLEPQDDWDWLRDLFPMSPAEVAKGDYESDEVANIRGAYRGSLDAAKRLHDALLDGWWATIRHSTRPMVTVGYVEPVSGGNADNPARAWLLAVLRALEAEGRG